MAGQNTHFHAYSDFLENKIADGNFPPMMKMKCTFNSACYIESFKCESILILCCNIAHRLYAIFMRLIVKEMKKKASFSLHNKYHKLQYIARITLQVQKYPIELTGD